MPCYHSIEINSQMLVSLAGNVWKRSFAWRKSTGSNYCYFSMFSMYALSRSFYSSVM